MRSTTLLTAVLAGAVGGCATLGSLGRGPDPETRLEAGLQALEADDMAEANRQLRWVWENHWEEPIGKHALLVLTAVELDPRNLQRRTDAAAEMSTLFLDMAETPNWMIPVAKTFYFLSREVDRSEDRIARLDAQLDNIPGLPPPGSVEDRIDALRMERDSLDQQVLALRQAVAARDQAIQEKDQELERIRRALTGGRGRGGGGGG